MRFPAKIQALLDTFFSNQPNRGNTAPELRQSIAHFAANLSNSRQTTAAIPLELEAYISKVALHAHKVTDEDVTELKALGYTEDDLFEITISAALGAGRARLNAGLAALRGDVVVVEGNRDKSSHKG